MSDRLEEGWGGREGEKGLGLPKRGELAVQARLCFKGSDQNQASHQ